MDIEEKAILRLQEAAQMSQQIYEKPLILTYSGGKDSDVTLDLAIKAGIPFEAAHSLTTVDMPETVYHVRRVFARLEEKGIPCKIIKPTYKRAYIRAFDKMLDVRKAKGLPTDWKTGEEVFEWWVSK